MEIFIWNASGKQLHLLLCILSGPTKRNPRVTANIWYEVGQTYPVILLSHCWLNIRSVPSCSIMVFNTGKQRSSCPHSPVFLRVWFNQQPDLINSSGVGNELCKLKVDNWYPCVLMWNILHEQKWNENIVFPKLKACFCASRSVCISRTSDWELNLGSWPWCCPNAECLMSQPLRQHSSPELSCGKWLDVEKLASSVDSGAIFFNKVMPCLFLTPNLWRGCK